MNSEQSRLQSFDIWRNSGPACPRMLSASGFYATGDLFEVECNWCHFRVSDWNFNENIEQRHMRLNPYCEFITNWSQCGNIPLVQLQEQTEVINVSPAAKGNATLDLLIEKHRLATFVNWPNPNISPQSLAKAGFFYRNRLDEVECAWCKGVIAKWEKQDNAFEEHRRFFPECPRVQLGPLIEISNDGIRDLGIQQISPPKNPKYSSLHSRLRTYSNWPIPNIQRPEDLAQAGLYYQKVDDQVRCFHCNMGLRSWEKEDDPWFEHAKWYPMCEFVRLVKGINYIQEVQELTRTGQKADNSVAVMTIEEAMSMEPVQLALEMGVNSDMLHKKIQQKIEETGRPFETIDDLLKAVFDKQENVSSDLENTPQTSSGIRQAENNKITYNDTSRNSATMGLVLNRTCTFKAPTAASIEENDKHIQEISKPNPKLNQIEDASPRSEEKIKLTLDRNLLEEENRKLKDARLCKVCLDEEVGVVYLPCGHLVTCVQCAPGVSQCPMCRTKIKGFVRTYLS